MIDVDDPYTAYCFDEACAMIQQRIKNGEEPTIKEEPVYTHYTTPSQLYANYDN